MIASYWTDREVAAACFFSIAERIRKQINEELTLFARANASTKFPGEGQTFKPKMN